MKPNITLKLTAAIVIGGVLCRPGALVEVTESEAKDLLRRGKAVVATEADQGSPLAAITNGEDGALNPEVQAANAALFAAASEDNPVDAEIDIAGKPVAVKVIGLDGEGAPIVTDASADALEAAALRDAADKAVASAKELTSKARTRPQKTAAEKATAAAAEAVSAAEAAEAKAAASAG